MSRSISAAFAACVLFSGCRVGTPGAYRVIVKTTDGREPEFALLSKTPPREEAGVVFWTEVGRREETRLNGFKIARTEPIMGGVWAIAHDGLFIYLSSTEPRTDGNRVLFTDALTGASRSETLPLGASWKKLE